VTSRDPFRVGFVTGATPDKWAGVWRERYPRERLELVPVTEAEQETLLRDGSLDMALVRLPVDLDGVHAISLYDEVQVVVASRDHLVAAAEEVVLADLVDEQLVVPHRSGWLPGVPQLEWPPMTEGEAVETVAAGTGVAILPMSVARLFHRKDVVRRPVTDLDPTTVALAWLAERDDERTQRFVGVVRGRTARSSR
jgi:DNA-binding transcriptional LysR family regulator